MYLNNDVELKKILREAATIAVIGASPKPWRDSRSIMEYLLSHGYTVIPVNPSYHSVLDRECYPSLRDISASVDIVDVFRNPSEVLPIVDDAIAINAPTLWMQPGVTNEDAAARAHLAGMNVVMDRCIAVEHRHLIGRP